MKSAITGFVIALALFVAGAVSWNEAQLAQRVAEAHRRLATLHYDTEDDLDSGGHVWDRLLSPVGSAGGDVKRHRTTVSYWMKQYEDLNPTSLSTNQQPISDPALLMVAANASYRNNPGVEGKAAVDRLDTVMEAYAEVLRKDGNAGDAAFNYEFVSKERDLLAITTTKNRAEVKRLLKRPDLISIDLPTGPTVHGAPGGPPDGTDMSDFKTITPMRYDEREEEMNPSRGKTMKRRG